MDLLWGIDLGGTKIEGVVIARDNLTSPLVRLRVPTEASKGYHHLLRQLKSLLDLMESKIGKKPARLGLCHPGIIDPKTNLLKNSNTQILNGQPLGENLRRDLGIPIALANDANCFALAEALAGAGRGAKTVFGVIMGTGVGGGIVIDGKVHYGAQGIAGEWGHTVFDVTGEPCYCGRNGCVETVISGPAVERFYTRLSGTQRSLKEIDERQKEDPAARKTIEHLSESFGRAISQVINILDPDVIVLGGGVSNIMSLYDHGVRAASRWVFNNRLETVIRKNELGDSAGVFGAALL